MTRMQRCFPVGMEVKYMLKSLKMSILAFAVVAALAAVCVAAPAAGSVASEGPVVGFCLPFAIECS